MQISARNLLKGVISNVTEGAVNGVVTISLDNVDVKANITMEAINQLGLAEGKEAFAIIKASNVMFALGEEPITNISARNQLAGTVSEIKRGAVNGHVAIELANGQKVTGSITTEAIESLGLEVGTKALAVVKSTDVIVGVE